MNQQHSLHPPSQQPPPYYGSMSDFRDYEDRHTFRDASSPAYHLEDGAITPDPGAHCHSNNNSAHERLPSYRSLSNYTGIDISKYQNKHETHN